MESHSQLLKSLGLGTLTGMLVGLAGFLIASVSLGMGMVMFFLVPVSAGFTIGLVTPKGKKAQVSAMLAVGATLLILIATKMEGLLCAVMAFPLLMASIALGAWIGAAFRIEPGQEGRARTGMMVLAVPLLIFSAHKAEEPMLNRTRIETISTTVRLDASPELVWSHIQSIDSIHSRKPWLMHIGLPVPLRCTLQRTAVGARRTCYFDKGYIEETVTKWDAPHFMGLRIDRTHMPGRHWLGFESANYRLEQDGDSTLLTRTTIISSHLSPAWYWRPLERLGVESEHRYLLDDVVNRVKMEGTNKRSTPADPIENSER